MRDWTAASGLAIDLCGATNQSKVTVEIIEALERHTASFTVPPGGKGEIRLPWAMWARRDKQDSDWKASKAQAPDDGLQLTEMTYIALWPDEGAPLGLSVGAIRLYR